jgi:hypothetical protein
MYGGWEAQRIVERLFLIPRLVSVAWYICFRVSKVRGSDVWRTCAAQSLFLVPRLISPAKHLCLKVGKVYGADILGIPGGPEDVIEAVSRPPSGQPSLAPLPQGE